MITGLKIARGALVQSRVVEGMVNGGFEERGPDVPVGGDSVVEVESESRERSGWDGGRDFVFAYQVVRIKSRKDGRVREDAYNKGAQYSADDEADEEESVEELHNQWEVGNVDGEFNGEPTFDEDGLDCFIVVG